MAGIKLRFYCCLFLIFQTVFANNKITSKMIYTKVPFKGQAVSIWKENSTFYTFPLAYLEKDSIILSNKLDQPTSKKLLFDIILTNEELRKASVNHLRVFTGKCVQLENIQMVPTANIQVILKSRPENYIQLNKQWNISMVSNPEILKMTIPCLNNPNVDVCQLFKNMLEGDPLLELHFNVTGTEFRLPVKRIGENSTINAANTKKMVKCKPPQEVNMEKLIDYVKSIAVSVKESTDIMKAKEEKCTFGDSNVLKGTKMTPRLLKMIQGVTTGNGCWMKCYTGSYNNFSAPVFHSMCDNVGPTVTLLRVGEYISGGYTDLSWSGGGAYKESKSSFLFSLNFNVKTMVGTANRAIYVNNGYGPTYGANHDLRIYHKCNENTNSYTNVGNSYPLPSGLNKYFQTGGKHNFQCTEYEVYYQKSTV